MQRWEKNQFIDNKKMVHLNGMFVRGKKAVLFLIKKKKKRLCQYLTTNVREKCVGRRKKFYFILNLAKIQEFLNQKLYIYNPII